MFDFERKDDYEYEYKRISKICEITRTEITDR